MRKIITICIIGLFALNVQAQPVKTLKLSDKELLDKIKGGWAGQTIGVVFGAPTEFKFTGTYIQDYQPIPWAEGYVKYWWEKKPGLFDDIYNDCTFVEAFDELGLDCSQEELAKRFAFADYHLAHANQAGRYNIRQGIMPPASGHWLNNPHADDLDFQIEADFIGLMAPAMLPEALDIASRVGHIMNSGDGFYGGAFVAALYSSAFYEKSPEAILKTAISVIPEESTFHQCISLETIVIPASLVSFSMEVSLNNSYSLKQFIVAEDNPVFSTINGVLYNKDKSKLVFYPNASGTSLIIPKEVNSIDDKAFSSCNSLKEIHCLAENPPKCNSYVFSSLGEKCVLYVPKGSYSSYWVANGWGDFLNIIEE